MTGSGSIVEAMPRHLRVRQTIEVDVRELCIVRRRAGGGTRHGVTGPRVGMKKSSLVRPSYPIVPRPPEGLYPEGASRRLVHLQGPLAKQALADEVRRRCKTHHDDPSALRGAQPGPHMPCSIDEGHEQKRKDGHEEAE